MRVTFWIPRTRFGFVAALVSGLLISAFVYVVIFGNPPLDAHQGTSAYTGMYNGVLVALIAAVSGGSWFGTELEKRRAVREVQASLGTAMLDGYLARREAEESAALASIAGQPWAQEAMEARRRVYARMPRLSSVFDGFNPYFCLSTATLLRFGFTTPQELAQLNELVASREFPARWENPMILRDLELLYEPQDSLVRIGLAARHLEQAERQSG